MVYAGGWGDIEKNNRITVQLDPPIGKTGIVLKLLNIR